MEYIPSDDDQTLSTIVFISKSLMFLRLLME